MGESMSERPHVAVPEPEHSRPMNDEEYAEWLNAQTDEAAEALQESQRAKDEEIRRTLAATDQWAARAVEEGVPMTPERVAYRRELRALLGKTGKSADPVSIEIPAEPAPPAS